MACIDLPSIVAKQSFLSKTAALASTAIYTPTANGVFRVSVGLEITTGGTDNVTATVTWTDAYHSQTADMQKYSRGIYDSGFWGVLTMPVASGNAIAISASYVSGSYNLYVVVEQLM
jgi:hypothetical protein